MSEQLLTLVNNPAVRADEKLYAAIEEKYLKSCCRESEFDTVLMSMIDINDDVESPKLHQTIGEWMVKLAPSMHGTGELLKLQSHPSFVALQTLLKELGGNDQAAISAETRENLVSAAKNLQAHMRQLERSERSADKAFFREAEAVFKQIIGALENPRKAAIDSVLSRHIKACFNLPPALDFSDELLKELASSRKLNCPLLAKFISLCRSVDQLAKAYVERRIARIRPVLQQR